MNHILDDLNLFEGALLDPGLPAALGFDSMQRLLTTYQRYENNISIRLSRTSHELERLQRLRNGERLPAPSVVDVTVHAAESSLLEAEKSPLTSEYSVPPVSEQPKSLSSGVDVDMQAET
jgi:hypothetical protein